MASERIYAPVSRPVQRTGVISSRAMLGGLHQHYARVQVFGTHRRSQRCLVVPDGPDRWRHRRSRPTHGLRPRANGNERSPRGRRHAGRMRSGTDRPPGHSAISFGIRQPRRGHKRLPSGPLSRFNLLSRRGSCTKNDICDLPSSPERAIKIDEIRRELRVAVGKIIFALEQLGLCRDDIQDRTRTRLGVQTRSPKWRL